MFRHRDNILRIEYIASDLIMTAIAFFIFNLVRYYFMLQHSWEDLASFIFSKKIVWEQIIVPPVLLIVYVISGYYNTPFPRSRLSEALVTAGSSLFNTFLIFMTMLINDPMPRRRYEYLLVFLLFLILFGCVYLGRVAITTYTLRRVRKSNPIYKTIVVGDSERGVQAARLITESNSVYQNIVVALVHIDGEKSATGVNNKYDVIEVARLKEYCREHRISQIVLAPETIGDRNILSLVGDLIELDIPIRIAPDDLDYALAGIRTNDILGQTLIDLSSPRLSEFSQNMKRLIDLTISSLLLILLLPAFLVIAIIVKMDSKGPIFYTQERMGLHHRTFKIIKFRTMRTDAEINGPKLSSDNDPRVTKVGRILRKYRIDEWPQLVNVILGEMSIVGPRPEREYYINQIVKKAPYYSLIYQVRPGITSWAMVKFGYASSIDQMVERTKFDMIYINNMSLLLDMKILLHTVRTVLSGAGK